MRIHITLPFSEAHEEYTAARHEYATFDDNDRAAEEQANTRLDQADDRLWGAPAITPTEIAMKIRAAKERGSEDFPVETFYSTERMLTDLDRMQGWPLSPEFVLVWRAWRNVAEELANVRESPDEDRWSTVQAQLYAETVMRKCTTPGDFILKQYLRLHTSVGGTFYGAAKEDNTGNPWDIDITACHGKPRFECADELGCYDDIDSTDIGANLLAYGQPHFAAKAWLDRADAIGHRAYLVQHEDGRWMFGQHMDLEGEQNRGNNERLRREQDRLMRLLSNGYGEDRFKLVADEIRRGWPQLMISNPLAAEPVAEAVAA